ncbi:MAG: polyribonucleotide nucleotidyltransferase [bacterium]
MSERVEMELGGRTLSIETGLMAKQADGAVTVQYGDSMVLVAAQSSDTGRGDQGFLPLTVNYQEKTYASGKIPGGFFKREGRPTERETLTCRLIDRPIRPLFPKNFFHEIQVTALVLSCDEENDPDILGLIGASAALSISSIPFAGPIGGVKVGCINNDYVINPTFEQLKECTIDITLAGTEEAVVMIEGAAKEVSEDLMKGAVMYGHNFIKEIIRLQSRLIKAAGKEKMELPEPECLDSLIAELRGSRGSEIVSAIKVADKKERESRLKEIKDGFLEGIDEEDEQYSKTKKAYASLLKTEMRRTIMEEGKRADGRTVTQIRPISSIVNVLPRAHGSALFTRGETQALCAATLGTSQDEQIIDDLEGKSRRSFMLHYNFPPFSVGEVRRMVGPGRREIGHGKLAERALSSILPDPADFPYTIRLVSEILESNGSSSMATICGGCLSMMDAGVPISSPVAGIAMGLIIEGNRSAVLSDILGLEDHLGDMDFKIAGTPKGLTAIQLDVKIKGISEELLAQVLSQAKEGRMHILSEMDKALNRPRQEISRYAPRITTYQIDKNKIRDVIGSGGKVIRSIIEQSGADVNIEDDGVITVSAVNLDSVNKALELIKAITDDIEIDKIYQGKIKKIVDFGAFVEIAPGTEGLLHISQIAERRINRVEDVLTEGENIKVKVLDIDRMGRIKLSRKAVLAEG